MAKNLIFSPVFLMKSRKTWAHFEAFAIFSYAREIQKFSDAPAWGEGEICTKMCFFGWHVGFVVLLFLCCFPDLALNPPCFLLVCFWFSWVFWCVFFWFGFVCSFSFENGWVCVFVVRIRQTCFILKDVFVSFLLVSLFLSP